MFLKGLATPAQSATRSRAETSVFASAHPAPRNAIALIFDLEGFSGFFNQPDVHDYLPVFINRIFGAVDICISGGLKYWEREPVEISPLLVQLVHMKFMGDGGLYVFLPHQNETAFRGDTIRALLNRIWNLKSSFDVVLEKCADEIPVMDLPQRIRFGVSRGSVLELHREDGGPSEYVGFCINLASRLQRYCPELGFLGSARLGLPERDLRKHDYMKVVATKIKGFTKEIVIVDKEEFEALPTAIAEDLFERLPTADD